MLVLYSVAPLWRDTIICKLVSCFISLIRLKFTIEHTSILGHILYKFYVVIPWIIINTATLDSPL